MEQRALPRLLALCRGTACLIPSKECVPFQTRVQQTRHRISPLVKQCLTHLGAKKRWAQKRDICLACIHARPMFTAHGVVLLRRTDRLIRPCAAALTDQVETPTHTGWIQSRTCLTNLAADTGEQRASNSHICYMYTTHAVIC